MESQKQDQLASGRLGLTLEGFMGSGKSALLQKLQEDCPLPSFDLDSEIEKVMGMKISEIIENDGWETFRANESKILSQLLLMPCLIALGGGASEFSAEILAAGRQHLRVWLDIPFEICWERIKGDSSRPLVKTEDQLRKLYNSRCCFYKNCDLKLQQSDIEQIASWRSAIDVLHKKLDG